MFLAGQRGRRGRLAPWRRRALHIPVGPARSQFACRRIAPVAGRWRQLPGGASGGWTLKALLVLPLLLLQAQLILLALLCPLLLRSRCLLLDAHLSSTTVGGAITASTSRRECPRPSSGWACGGGATAEG